MSTTKKRPIVAMVIAGVVILLGIAMQLSGVDVFTKNLPAPALGLEDHEHVRKALKAHGWAEPTSLQLRDDGFIVIDYEVPDTVAVSQRRAFAEERLLAIREELLVEGYKNFRLNLNGPPPGRGLVRRYGSARIVESGELEWVTP